ncbi:MAG: hypothetical protein K2X38_25470 [Gemmataceae bacterium]|nr:hypothetical protein [Gemmataceae bacterium]
MELKIQRMGTLKVAVGDGQPVEFDGIGTWDRWNVLDWTFRDEKGAVKPDQFAAWQEAKKKFVAETLQVEAVTLHEVRQFFDWLTERVKELRDFFEPKRSETPSSPASTDANFAQ